MARLRSPPTAVPSLVLVVAANDVMVMLSPPREESEGFDTGDLLRHGRKVFQHGAAG